GPGAPPRCRRNGRRRGSGCALARSPPPRVRPPRASRATTAAGPRGRVAPCARRRARCLPRPPRRRSAAPPDGPRRRARRAPRGRWRSRSIRRLRAGNRRRTPSALESSAERASRRLQRGEGRRDRRPHRGRGEAYTGAVPPRHGAAVAMSFDRTDKLRFALRLPVVGKYLGVLMVVLAALAAAPLAAALLLG